MNTNSICDLLKMDFVTASLERMPVRVCQDDSDFQSAMAEAGAKPVVVDFSAEWLVCFKRFCLRSFIIIVKVWAM